MDMVCRPSTVSAYDIIKALVDELKTKDAGKIREIYKARGGYVDPEYLISVLLRLEKERDEK